VLYTGCEAVLDPGLICVPKPDELLTLWFEARPEDQVEIRAGGERLAGGFTPVGEGRQYDVKVPPGARRLEVIAEIAGRRREWSLALGPRIRQTEGETPHDVLYEVREVIGQIEIDIQEGRLAVARETLKGLRLPLQGPAELRCLLAYNRSLLYRQEGDYRSALVEVWRAVEIAERVGIKRSQWVAEGVQTLLLLDVGRSREAAEAFEKLVQNPPVSATDCDLADMLNNQAWSALLAREAGEAVADPTPLFQRALTEYGSCERFQPKDRANMQLNMALAHLVAGRAAQARDLLLQADTPAPPVSFTLWRLDLEARLALAEGKPKTALALFDRLEQLALAAGSPDGRLRAALGKARSQVALHKVSAAVGTLEAAEMLLDEQSLQIPVDQGRNTFMAARQSIVGLHLQILLGRDRNAEALTVARRARSRMLRQLARADRLVSLEADERDRWERLVTEYHARRAAQEERAKDDWKLADDQLRQEQAARQAESEALKRLLDEIFRVLESARDGHETLVEPRPGDLILSYHPLLLHRWAGFASDGRTVTASTFELPSDTGALSDEELSRRLLLPFKKRIERAKRIRVLPAGRLESVDFHALPFGNAILLAGRPVVYGLDLPGSAAPVPLSGRHALLVADPRGDLPGTRVEVESVARILTSGPRPWTTEELKNTEASAESVQRRLAAADLLHYAGHGSFSGFGGWESRLLLANKTQLTLRDFLSLRVPSWVVLSGCDTGRSSSDTSVQGLSLAHAFLLAGSRAVIASTRPANDQRTPRFFADLYREWNREPDLSVALQRAQLSSWRQRKPKKDWVSFRLFEP
jgi:tetratricopeptide (TPR) repeat protein